MPTNLEWSIAFAQQARADLDARKVLIGHAPPSLPQCQQLHFLQMCCEKLCKSHIALNHPSPENLMSHAVVAGVLPVFFRMQFTREYSRSVKDKHRVFKQVKHLAREIELLAPAVDDANRRRDNCEYPWLDANRVRVPAKWGFTNLDLLRQPNGKLLLKLIENAIGEREQPPPGRP